MFLLDLTLPTLPENLALDEALLLNAETGGPEVLRLWEWPMPAVVLGAAGKLADEIDEPACIADGVPIARRSSGGGTVLLGTGCLVYSLVLVFERDPALGDLHASYRYILGRIERAIQQNPSLTLPARLQGLSDLALGERKFSGNSQQRKRTHLLHHGTLLYAFDATRIARYLKAPPRQPEYRQGRAHADFVTNLPIPVDELHQALCNAWGAIETLSEWPETLTRELTKAKYGRDEWTRRR